MALNHLGRKDRASRLGHTELDLPGDRGQAVPTVPGPVRLPLVRALVAPGVHDLVGLLIQEPVERILDGLPDELAEVLPELGSIERYHHVWHGPAPPVNWFAWSPPIVLGWGHVPYVATRLSKVRRKLYVIHPHRPFKQEGAQDAASAHDQGALCL